MSFSLKKFNESIESLHSEILGVIDDGCISGKEKELYIIAQSRKGPNCLKIKFGKNLEELLNKYAQDININVITEHSLPLFAKKHKDKHINYIHIDDALYFGTTAEATAKEIDEFFKLYNIHSSEKRFYCAVKSKNVKMRLEKSLGEIYPKEPIISGEEHFFVKQLLSRIRSLKSFMEIEFPIVEYKIKSNIDSSSLFEALKNTYKTSFVYDVEHSENISITILLDNINGSLFNKLRIILDGNSLRIMSVAPRTLPNNFSLLKNIFNEENPFYELWNKIYSSISYNNDKSFNTEETDRRRNKSTIVLANYLLSYDTIVREKRNVENILHFLNVDYTYQCVNVIELNYLIGDLELSNEIRDRLYYIYENGLVSINTNYNIDLIQLEEQIFERTSKEFTEQKIVEMNYRNEIMLRQCRNLEEILSTLFFNQYIFLDQLTRYVETAKSTRLRFGYTFNSLIKIIKRQPQYIVDNSVIQELHEWIDRKIDEGCIVPQYVVDEKTNYWIRVFRPGENEDTLLGHLSRFAVFILLNSWTVKKLGWITLDEYERIMVIAFDIIKDSNKIIESKNITLIKENGKLYIAYRNREKTLVSDYMNRMSIISINDNIVKILPRILETTIVEATTLSDEDEKEIKNRISKRAKIN